MGKPRKTKMIVTGVALMLCLPAFAIVPSLVAYYLPRLYYSKTTVEYTSPQRDEFYQAFQSAAQQFGKAAELRAVRNTDLFEIGIYDPISQNAADKANSLAESIKQKLSPQENLFQQDKKPRVKFWERAEPAIYPSRPNVSLILFLGIGIGLLVAAVGVVLLIIGLIGTANAQSSQQNA